MLLAAYDDAAGVTAKFNMNMLIRINRELDASFNTQLFRHQARWNEQHSRIEMHLESLLAQKVSRARTGPGGALSVWGRRSTRRTATSLLINAYWLC